MKCYRLLPTRVYLLHQLKHVQFGYINLNDKNILVEHLAKNKKPVIFPVKAITSYLPHDFEKVFAEKTLRFAPLLDLEILDAMLMMVINPTILITKEHQHLMNGIAHQSALAIQRVRLIEAQREEAYVSTALLQVAQNLARTINLPHVLDMVTRLTPMLVGVTQCFIFLANDKASLVPPGASNLGLTDKASLVPPGASCYRLEAMYGVDGFDIHPKTPCDYWQELPSLIRDSVQYPIDVGNRLPPILQAVFPHGQLHTFLFPLQAQGNLIGCLLVGDTKMPILSLRREIITGIAYQTALAIDNAMLHAEHMNQKQLQHDLELARDIQRSFMPQDLPTLHDWDMATRWEMAHKVGGDFFDLISLSKHHLLIIIADVANKGLPAALFMAKTISLIRVTSLELSEPAEILDRVNKLLLPDSSGGMFVTVFCAVLERETGHLKYTSGGHNPPILLRKSGESIMLRTQGIILGVFDGMDFEQKSDTLHVGDGVLFYTDGVTEAFNSDDEMFGEDRLLHVLKENWHCSADEIAGKIQKSINDFAYPRSQSDDFTLLLVKRT
ncbi:MAG: hypothetical protein B6242_10550 [Anaerolineaceae bacterium 4572_78]|nr:MAG: hypothetical protein B6242_10550 [Anaerolineaceae bacterium 4572_78]